MKRFFWKQMAVVAALVLICGSPAAIHAQDADKIELAEITERLTQWRGSFVNLRMVYELRTLPPTPAEPLNEWPAPESFTTARLFHRGEWIWADHGLDLLEDRFFHVPGGLRNIEVFNGPKGVVFRANYRQSPEGREELKELMLRGLGVGKPISWKSRTAIEGLYWSVRAAWLPEMLAELKWTVEAIEDVGGERCARIVAADPQFAKLTFWLDLDHDCLVRRRLTPALDYMVDEFQQLENGIWFPKRGRSQLRSDADPSENQRWEIQNQLWEITEVAINQSLDLSRFEPPQPVVGTIVDDGKGRVTAHGVTAGINQPGTTPGITGDPTPQQLASHSATPPTSAWLWWSSGLVIVAFLLLVAGIWLSHRH